MSEKLLNIEKEKVTEEKKEKEFDIEGFTMLLSAALMIISLIINAPGVSKFIEFVLLK